MIISLYDWLFACAKYKRILTFKRDQKNSFISSRFLKTNLTKICSYLREKASKGRFFGADKLQNHTNEEKAKEKKKERRGEEKKAMASLLLFIMATSEIGRKKNCWTRKVHLVVTFSKIRLDKIYTSGPPF